MENEIIKFIRQKDFRFIEEIGQGGTGRTVLLEDETINERFVCKKYSPNNPSDRESYFPNFIDEIKILHLLNHRNVVRVFNYYLYPERSTGYILMEYVQGEKISDFLEKNPEKLNDIFIQVIEGFKYLEENKVLHRDIRPDNILISQKDVAKIIDFGFGKKIELGDGNNKSISLNWRYSIPEEFNQKIYDSSTEVYFVGKLFEEIITQGNLLNFGYSAVLAKMTTYAHGLRIKSFFDLQRLIVSDKSTKIVFTNKQKNIYAAFADNISSVLSQINTGAEYIRNIETIISNLEKLYQHSMLELYIQDPSSLVGCFMNGSYRYYKKHRIEVVTLKNFLDFFKFLTKDKQKIVLNNIWQRLDAVNRPKEIDPDEIPF